MEPSEFGRKIGASEAQTYIEDYKTLRNTLIEEILPLVPDNALQEVKNSATFHKSKINAFVFDAALIRSLLDEPDAAQYFAVFLGAIGVNPTVVLIGLVEGSQPNTLIPRSAAQEVQHPRFVPDAKYPGLGSDPLYINGN